MHPDNLLAKLEYYSKNNLPEKQREDYKIAAETIIGQLKDLDIIDTKRPCPLSVSMDMRTIIQSCVVPEEKQKPGGLRTDPVKILQIVANYCSIFRK